MYSLEIMSNEWNEMKWNESEIEWKRMNEGGSKSGDLKTPDLKK